MRRTSRVYRLLPASSCRCLSAHLSALAPPLSLVAEHRLLQPPVSATTDVCCAGNWRIVSRGQTETCDCRKVSRVGGPVRLARAGAATVSPWFSSIRLPALLFASAFAEPPECHKVSTRHAADEE